VRAIRDLAYGKAKELAKKFVGIVAIPT